MKSRSKKRTPSIVNLTVKRRRYLTQREIERLMDCARKHGRYGHRDATMILVAYRHGLRASEVCDLQWQQIELSEGRLHVRRVKSGIPSVHPIRGDEMRALRKLRRDYPTDAYVFVSERGGPISPIGFHRLVQRLGEAATMPVGSSSQMTATTRGPCSTTSGTRTSSTRFGTPTWRPIASRTFGGADDDGGPTSPCGLPDCFLPPTAPARRSATEPPHREVTSPQTMAPCAACAPSGGPRRWEARARAAP
jgi:hypothetical protein